MSPEQRLKMHEDRLVTLIRRFGSEGAPAAAARVDIARALEELGRFDEAQLLMEKALEAYRTNLGEEHRVTISAEEWLASNHARAGRFEEARALAQHAFEVSERALGPDDDLTMWAKRFLNTEDSPRDE